ncbi:DUF3329 domain-containing protein [Paenirhodobacter populi]|uniref:DUF3329 domain-containing protein n=1 Tax=Paenirhodobacter populi TaxID=2306993 RepID=A0A443IP41_9RHOB|nr:DUF3329 domain-containing protein [Sinirhodobacter populi]RWR05837.1 DUF3329 domain-containing protein [Sinirhodobacter populi]RWR07536.1 DUF3329 domain-containing protein [Sinirhodobacter populi]RWR19278.1 DUF3329 domain-containing protein [Sinirhodobacter populi]RWR31048.1 DUF3329 domain-containing protein [Sinirhodobacter populi]
MFDLDDPRFRPLWLRVLLTGICLLWAVFEFATGSPGWGLAFLALGGWVGWRFFVTFRPRDETGEGK